MLERTVEHRLVMETEKRGGRALKFVSPGWDGAPDRLVLLPAGHMGFVEVKAPGQKPRPLQLNRMARLRKLGFLTFVLDDPAKVNGILDEIGGDAR